MLVNLMDLINFSDDERLSQKYVKYYLNFKVSKQYRHEEIITIKKMVELLDLDYEYLGGFTYSFILPHLNKELDLIKVTKNSVINIELKSAKVSDGRILKQLNQNKYYLHLIHKPLYQYTYVMSENTFYKIDNDSIVMAKPEEVRKLLLNHKKAIPIDLGDIFKPENIFASPFYMTSRFIQNDYLLTDSEQLVERQIIKFLENDEDVIVEGPTGSGKTMVLYDVARKLEKGIIISPYQVESFQKLNEAFPSFKTISIEEFRNFDDIKYCFIDEVSKIETQKINDIILEGKRKNIRIVLFLDLKENDEIDLIAGFRVKTPFSIFSLGSYQFRQRVHTRAFTGVERREKENEKDCVVYLTETGTVYHRSLDCSYLKLTISKVLYRDLANLRNSSGGKYKMCERCCHGITPQDGEEVYITIYGDRYHKSHTCSGLKRTIREIMLSQVGNRAPCSKCGGKEK